MLSNKRVHNTLIALIMEAASTSETSVNFYEIIRRNIPEDKPFSLVVILYSHTVSGIAPSANKVTGGVQ
jgi:hypothetical protein